MVLKNIMNQNGILNHDSSSTIEGGTFTIVSTPSIKSKILGAGVFRDTLEYTFSGGTAPGVVAGTVRTLDPQEIAPTAIKDKADGLPVIREDDSGTMSAVGDNPSPPPTTLAVSGDVIVESGGQNKVKGQ